MITEGVEDKLCVLEGVILEVRDEIKGKVNIDKEEWREVQKQIQELKKDMEIIKIHKCLYLIYFYDLLCFNNFEYRTNIVQIPQIQ